MGCKKLTYYESQSPLKVVYRKVEPQQKVVQRFLSVDPMAHLRVSLTPYNFCSLDPINRTDPTGALDDEWNLNTETGEMTWVSDLGGDEVQFVNFVTPHENGAMEWHGTSYIDGAEIYSGPMANNYDGDFTYGVSNVDLWADVPTGYYGHYMAWDLKTRYTKLQQGPKEYSYDINYIRKQEALGLDRRQMIWNQNEYRRYIIGKYGSDASFNMAAEEGMLPVPVGMVGTLGYTAKALQAGAKSGQFIASPYFTGGTRGSQYFNSKARTSTSTSSSANSRATTTKLSNNPWIRFLQLNKGTFKGSNWMNEARAVYYMQQSK